MARPKRPSKSSIVNDFFEKRVAQIDQSEPKRPKDLKLVEDGEKLPDFKGRRSPYAKELRENPLGEGIPVSESKVKPLNVERKTKAPSGYNPKNDVSLMQKEFGPKIPEADPLMRDLEEQAPPLMELSIGEEIPRYDIGREYAPGDVSNPDELAYQNMIEWTRRKNSGEL